MENFVVKSGRKLRLGYTTGSCATAAATAAAEMLFSQQSVENILISLPSGERVAFLLEDPVFSERSAACAVIKDAGDDPDVTDGMKIVAECSFAEAGITIRGGQGVGVVTSDGLPVRKGEAAINPVPRKMIAANVEAVCAKHHYTGGIAVTILAPGGENIARKTFNPRLGIEGGISILGTTGIVEPMSEKALVETIKLHIDKRYFVNPDILLLTPGNYGSTFCSEKLGLNLSQAVKFSNFLGESLDYVAYKKFANILLVGHLGKLVKVAGGIMNTHSSVADCRMEIFAAHAACAGADQETALAFMDCKTTDAVADLLEAKNLQEAVYKRILEQIMFHLHHRLAEKTHIEAIIFSQDNIVMQSPGALHLVHTLSGGKA